MMLRAPIAVAALVAASFAPLPALAEERPLAEAAAKLSDSRVQASMAAALAALGEALLDMPVGPMLRAIEGVDGTGRESPVPADARLRDLTGAEAEAMPAELADKVPAMMAGMAGMAGALEAMLPDLEALAKRMAKTLPRE